MFPPSCTQTNIHTFAPHVDTQKWTRYPHSHSPYALYTPRSRHHHPQRGSQRPIPELNPLRSGVGTGGPPRSPQQQRKSTAQTPTGRPVHPVLLVEKMVSIALRDQLIKSMIFQFWGFEEQCRESLSSITIRDKRAGREGKKGEDGEREKMRPPPLRAKEETCIILRCTFITFFVNLATHPFRKLTMVLLKNKQKRKHHGIH